MTDGKPLPNSSISSGVDVLDHLINGFSIGDNVVWEVEAGTAYDIFIRNFLRRSFADAQKVIYLSCNRSPQTILSSLGPLIKPEHFTLVDGFTSGKGKNDNTFLRFYDKPTDATVVRIENPKDIDRFTATLNAIEDSLPPGARYVFDSLTGMQDLWGDEGETHRFFTYMCPRLYDLGTVAYWLLEKDAHSPKFKANLRHITQVVLDLYKRKNALFIKALKLEGRQHREAFKPHAYEVQDDVITIAPQRKEAAIEIGGKLKTERIRIGMSQKELADQVNVTPSFLSQLENDQVSPSLPTFLQICRVLGVNPGQFLGAGQEKDETTWLLRRVNVLSRPIAREDAAKIYNVAPEGKHSVRLVVLPAGTTLNRHFSFHKEAEFIYVIKGDVAVTMGGGRNGSDQEMCFVLRSHSPHNGRIKEVMRLSCLYCGRHAPLSS